MGLQRGRRGLTRTGRPATLLRPQGFCQDVNTTTDQNSPGSQSRPCVWGRLAHRVAPRRRPAFLTDVREPVSKQQHNTDPRGTNTHGKAKGRVTESSRRPAGPRAGTRGTRVGPRVPVGRGRPPRATSSPVRPRAVFKSCTSTRRKQDAVFTILDWSRLS